MKTYRALVVVSIVLALVGTWIYIDVHLKNYPSPLEQLSRSQIKQLNKELVKVEGYEKPDKDVRSMSDQEIRLWLFPDQYKRSKSRMRIEELLIKESPSEEEQEFLSLVFIEAEERGLLSNRALELVKEAQRRNLLKQTKTLKELVPHEEIIVCLADAIPKDERQKLVRELFRREQLNKLSRKRTIANGIAISFFVAILGVILLLPVPAYAKVFRRNPRKHVIVLMIIFIGLFNSLALLDLPITSRELTTLIVFNLTVLTVGGLILYLLRRENS